MGTKAAWTLERKAKQREIIRRTKPWEKSTGPTTPLGKCRSAQNRIDTILNIINVHEAVRLFQADPDKWITVRRSGQRTIRVRKKGWCACSLERLEETYHRLNRQEMDRQIDRCWQYGGPFSGVLPPREERTEQEFEDGRNGWTAARRARQSNAIHRWKPWTRCTGPRMPEEQDRSVDRA